MKKSALKRKKPLAPKGPGKKKKPASNRGDLKAQAREAKLKRYREICLLVDERDKGRCQHPGCHRRGTQHHHIIFRCEAGADDLENLVLLCNVHHTGETLNDPCPHNYKVWRDYWKAWQRAKYPEYAAVKRPYEAPIDPKELQDIGEWSEELADFTI